MQISLNDAQNHLTYLVSRAAAGEEIVLTDGERPVAYLVAAEFRTVRTKEERRAILEAIHQEAAVRARSGTSAARSQDFLYRAEDGLPG